MYNTKAKVRIKIYYLLLQYLTEGGEIYNELTPM